MLFNGVVFTKIPSVARRGRSLFGDWLANRNKRCVEEQQSDIVYLNKSFAAVSDERSVLHGRHEETRRHGFPADNVLQLQQFLELQGRRVRFLTDVSLMLMVSAVCIMLLMRVVWRGCIDVRRQCL